ncbi:MAG: helix-turn-helix domain-containing protein [Gemmatimonadaceae bacterium]|nr:helix-turn-helix domain-containing protein [Gemmatimonadaceae bacterium]
MTAKEAQVYIGEQRVDTSYRRVRSKQMPPYRLGRSLRFSRAALDRFMENGGTAGTESAA